MSKVCVLFGDRSDIAKALVPFLVADGWTVHGWNRETQIPKVKWDLFLCAVGQVAPVGHWFDHDPADCVTSNLLVPINLLRSVWALRSADSTACFMGGSNPQKIMDGYLPYNVGKMALLKAVEQIDHESLDCRVFALGPGYFRDSKIHKATLDADWPNERIARGDAGTPIEKIWDCLKWCIENREAVGGRNVCASDPLDAQRLIDNPRLFKLRRVE